MRDVVLITTVVAFFALAVLYVRWCDRIVGPDDDRVADERTEPVAHR